MIIGEHFTQKLPSDPITDNHVRTVKQACFSYVQPKSCSNPQWVHLANDLATSLNIDALSNPMECLNLLSGNQIPDNIRPYAMAYGGHQFGQWAGQLGDGRAMGLGEFKINHQWMSIQLKGAGPTPYSRRGDGFAVLRSSIREHLCSEAMHYLGIPTTRSLSLIRTGDMVMRDVLYDGHPKPEPGAIIARIAPSFIRFGNFEWLSAQQDIHSLKQLADYTIQHYHPEIDLHSPNAYAIWFESVVNSTFQMILEWQRVGFVHGVMNTDNMSIHGITIDYGPYGWLDDYNPNWTPNTTDKNHRYAFDKQPQMALWNLLQLANAIHPLIGQTQPLEAALMAFQDRWPTAYAEMMLGKLGLNMPAEKAQSLLSLLDQNLQSIETDYTLFFRLLSKIQGDHGALDALDIIKHCFYSPLTPLTESNWMDWMALYIHSISNFGMIDRISQMNATNPKYVLRNYMAQMAIDQAHQNDYSLIETFYKLLQRSYDEQPQYDSWFTKRPEWARNKIGCSALSCSS